MDYCSDSGLRLYIQSSIKLPVSGKASESRTAGYHGGGHQLSSSGSHHPRSWHGECSPLWSWYLHLNTHTQLWSIFSYFLLKLSLLKINKVVKVGVLIEAHRGSQTFSECWFHWRQPWHASHPASGHSWTAIWRTSTVGGLLSKRVGFFSVKKKINLNIIFFLWVKENNFYFEYPPSGIKGIGGFTTVQPAFLNMSTWGKRQRALVSLGHSVVVVCTSVPRRGQHSTSVPGDMGDQGLTARVLARWC